MFLTTMDVGGSGVQSALWAASVQPTFIDGTCDGGGALALAVPGLVHDDGRVSFAANLGWPDRAWPAQALGLPRVADLVLNDADAAALGESVLRGGEDLAFISLGTGVGGAQIVNGEVVAWAAGHITGFSDEICPGCTATGCADTVIGGRVLPPELGEPEFHIIVDVISKIMLTLPVNQRLVLAGGVVRKHPELIRRVERDQFGRVEGSAAPSDAKSAAHWGLYAAWSTE